MLSLCDSCRVILRAAVRFLPARYVLRVRKPIVLRCAGNCWVPTVVFNSLPKYQGVVVSCMVPGRCIRSPLSSVALSGKPVKQWNVSLLEHSASCLSAKTSRPMSQLAPSPDLHSLESGANACYPPPTKEVRYKHFQHFNVL